jgi:hypothetical protein
MDANSSAGHAVFIRRSLPWLRSVWGLSSAKADQKEVAMRSLKTKSIISSALVVAALALTGNAAMAADLPVHKSTPATQTSRPRAAVHVAAPRRLPPAQYPFDIGQFIPAILGGPLPPPYGQIVRNAERAAASHRYLGSAESSGYSPSYDTSAPIDNSQSQAAIDASDQAIQQMDQDLFQMDETVDQ